MFTVEQVIESLNAAQEAINAAFERLNDMQNVRPDTKRRIEGRTKPLDPQTLTKKRKKNDQGQGQDPVVDQGQGQDLMNQGQGQDQDPIVDQDLMNQGQDQDHVLEKQVTEDLMQQVIQQDEEPVVSPRGVIVVQVPGQKLPSNKDELNAIIHEKESCVTLRQEMVKWLQGLTPLPVQEGLDGFIALVNISKQMSAQNEYVGRMGNHYPNNVKIVKRILLALPTDGFRKQLDKDGNPPKRNNQFGFYLSSAFF